MSAWTALLCAGLFSSTCVQSGPDRRVEVREPAPRPFVAAAQPASPEDAELGARLSSCSALLYDAGADEASDRPAFVRAASGLAAFGEHVAVVQDDVQFLGLWRPTGAVTALELPPGADSRRRFEQRFQNRQLKPDLESAISIPLSGGTVLFAFGSGAMPERRRILVVQERGAPRTRVVDGAELYRALGRAAGIPETALNIEGAAVSAGQLVLVQRGHGAAEAAVWNTAFGLELEAFFEWLHGAGPVPDVSWVQRYDLGRDGRVPFGFSGLTELGENGLVFTASAEETYSPLDDGPVLGSRIGVLGARGVRWTALRDAAGRPVPVKAESALALPGRLDRLWVVLDPDDTETPALLCDVQLSGSWHE